MQFINADCVIQIFSETEKTVSVYSFPGRKNSIWLVVQYRGIFSLNENNIIGLGKLRKIDPKEQG